MLDSLKMSPRSDLSHTPEERRKMLSDAHRQTCDILRLSGSGCPKDSGAAARRRIRRYVHHGYGIVAKVDGLSDAMRSGCYVETGCNQAAVIGGDFLADPKPKIELSEMTEEHFHNKHVFESSRLEKWFG